MGALVTTGLAGSYEPRDITFLLTPVSLSVTDIASKERLIQGGHRHYSEMISAEDPPSAEHRAIYDAALDAGAARMGREVAALAKAIAQDVPGPVTFASLLRAGVPLGILLGRALRRLGVDAAHFGVSIIRDRGLDHAAVAHILERRPPAGLVFVDGWTGKGAIAAELGRSLAGSMIPPRLVVLADPCGRAWLAASGEDWLIPSGVLGATVSGLVSRTILNDAIGPGRFHGCMTWHHLAPHDVSRAFVDRVWTHVEAYLPHQPAALWTDADRRRARTGSIDALHAVAARFGIDDLNRVKPGIAEATRAVMRRVPHRVLVASLDDPDVGGLRHLADRSGVPIEVASDLGPYRAITLIRKVK
ncbi:MAG: cysteine protease StiP family protein [Gemmatimonadaceae bacterium]|nr:cysteine protease StiP family protein [Acetobacteraceae bacterium]